MYRYLLQENVRPGSHLAAKATRLRRHIPLHWHDYIELEMIVGGSGWQSLNGHQTLLKRGCLSLLRLTDFHELAADSELQILKLAIDERFLSENLLAHLTTHKVLVFELDEKETQTIEKLLRLCIEENALDAPNTEYLQHILACVLLRILRLLPYDPNSISNDKDPMQAALLHLHMHFRENPSLAKLAKIAHYNTSHFSTTFHKQMGMTYTNYLNMLKTDYAKKLLLSTRLKVTDICYECGFTSHSNFLRLFHLATGLSPTAYRKRNRE